MGNTGKGCREAVEGRSSQEIDGGLLASFGSTTAFFCRGGPAILFGGMPLLVLLNTIIPPVRLVQPLLRILIQAAMPYREAGMVPSRLRITLSKPMLT